MWRGCVGGSKVTVRGWCPCGQAWATLHYVGRVATDDPEESTLVTPQRQSIGTLNPWRILDSGERFLRLVCAFQSCLISSHSLSEVRAVIQSFYSMKGWADGLTSGEHSLVGRGGPLCLVLTRARAPGSQRVLDPATQT